MPLYYAAMCAYSYHANVVLRTLLEYRANPRIPDGSGRTILHLLGRRGGYYYIDEPTKCRE